jgi:Transmembrane exosortase (Exosortase_EpsH)
VESRSVPLEGEKSQVRLRVAYPVRIYSVALFAALITSLIVSRVALLHLVRFSDDSEYWHIPLIPPISAFLMFVLRKSIFERAELTPWFGSCNVAGGDAAAICKELPLDRLDHQSGILSPHRREYLKWLVCGLVRFSDRAHSSPATVPTTVHGSYSRTYAECHDPVPATSSAVLSYELFRLLGVPALRKRSVVSLPRLTFRAAPECSGIRSSVSLLILAFGDRKSVAALWVEQSAAGVNAHTADCREERYQNRYPEPTCCLCKSGLSDWSCASLGGYSFLDCSDDAYPDRNGHAAA